MSIQSLLHRKLPTSKREQKAFSLRSGFYLYLVCFAAALLFTQTLKSPLSAMLLVFLLCLPFISLVYVLIAHAAIKVFVRLPLPTVEKLSPATYEILLHNDSPLTFPFVAAFCTIPSENTVRCISQKWRVSLLPFEKYHLRKTAPFKYRGNYDIGVTDILVLDLFRFFSIRIRINEIRPLSVLPRKLNIESASLSLPSEQSGEPHAPSFGLEQAEMREVRPYKIGDTPKNIHWKLSVKTEELQVRHYIPNPERKTLILCDLSERQPTSTSASSILDEYIDDMNEFCADAVMEMAVALTLQELRNGAFVRLAWFDKRSEAGYHDHTLDSQSAFDAIFQRFSGAPLTSTDNTVARLMRTVTDTNATSIILVTADLSAETITDTAALSGSLALSGIPVTLYLFNPVHRYTDPDGQRHYTDLCKKQLLEHGLAVTEWEGDLSV